MDGCGQWGDGWGDCFLGSQQHLVGAVSFSYVCMYMYVAIKLNWRWGAGRVGWGVVSEYQSLPLPEEEQEEDGDLVGGLDQNVAPHGAGDERGVALVGAALQQGFVGGLLVCLFLYWDVLMI